MRLIISNPSTIGKDLDHLMRRMEAAIHKRAVVADTQKIGPLGGMILLTLAEIEPAPVQTLAQRMARDKSQMTRLVQNLEGKGLLTRTPCTSDGRISLLSLTAAGADAVTLFRGITSEALIGILSPLTPNERADFAAILSKISSSTAGTEGGSQVSSSDT